MAATKHTNGVMLRYLQRVAVVSRYSLMFNSHMTKKASQVPEHLKVIEHVLLLWCVSYYDSSSRLGVKVTYCCFKLNVCVCFHIVTPAAPLWEQLCSCGFTLTIISPGMSASSSLAHSTHFYLWSCACVDLSSFLSLFRRFIFLLKPFDRMRKTNSELVPNQFMARTGHECRRILFLNRREMLFLVKFTDTRQKKLHLLNRTL